MSDGKRIEMDGTDWGKILKGALIAGLAAVIAYPGDAVGLVEMTPEMVVDGFPAAMIVGFAFGESGDCCRAFCTSPSPIQDTPLMES